VERKVYATEVEVGASPQHARRKWHSRTGSTSFYAILPHLATQFGRFVTNNPGNSEQASSWCASSSSGCRMSCFKVVGNWTTLTPTPLRAAFFQISSLPGELLLLLKVWPINATSSTVISAEQSPVTLKVDLLGNYRICRTGVAVHKGRNLPRRYHLPTSNAP
jgi:hypothetical protein